MIHRFVEVSYDPFVEVPICGEMLLVEYPLELPVEPPVVPSHARPVRAKGRVQGPQDSTGPQGSIGPQGTLGKLVFS